MGRERRTGKRVTMVDASAIWKAVVDVPCRLQRVGIFVQRVAINLLRVVDVFYYALQSTRYVHNGLPYSHVQLYVRTYNCTYARRVSLRSNVD